jgi:uncharacterized repeat protein (TIGR01451 family)/LPXTG-motif cell wall-anchored protein
MPAIALVLLALLRTFVVQAAPPAVPALGFTPTPTTAPSPTVAPETGSLSPCDPILYKQVDPSLASPGDLVTFTITVKNRGQQATVNGHVWDIVPSHLEVLEVETMDEHKGLLVHPIDEQTVRVDTGILGQDAELTILVHTRVRPFESGPTAGDAASLAAICIDNVAHFHADNCPEARAQAEPCLLPATGDETERWWVLAAVLATSVLVLGLVFSLRWWFTRPDRVR